MFRKLIVGLFASGVAFFAASKAAEADTNLVYIHGRLEQTWPVDTYLVPAPGFSNPSMPLNFDGNAPLADGAASAAVRGEIQSKCTGGQQCVVLCYSAGCARMFIAFKAIQDDQVGLNVLWTEATASAAGGSDLTSALSSGGLPLWAKLFGFRAGSAGDLAQPVDYDLSVNNMRNSPLYQPIQFSATAPVYHLAGGTDYCIRISIGWGPFNGVAHKKICGNSYLPGGYGDGLVPVHSAAGYADGGAHASHDDGSPKYPFRAYEQVPLFNNTHLSMLGPEVTYGDLRMGLNNSPNCPDPPPVDQSIGNASIIYQDADGALHQDTQLVSQLAMCGTVVYNGSTTHYSTCSGACCYSFSDHNAGGCACGESLCTQTQTAAYSYFANSDCTGTEYSNVVYQSDHYTFDGLGAVGENQNSVVVRSLRYVDDGRCQKLVRRMHHENLDCDEDFPSSTTIQGRVVYRAVPADHPDGYGEGVPVSTQIVHTYCP